VDELTPIQGDLQAQVMSALWRLAAGTVEQVRAELPPRYRGAYNTVQTVLNRLAERGLLERVREGRGFVYRPRVSEAEYLSGTIRHTLAGASIDARRAALASIIGGLGPGELDRIADLAQRAGGKRAP
jgi:predicted transcriptional regulator